MEPIVVAEIALEAEASQVTAVAGTSDGQLSSTPIERFSSSPTLSLNRDFVPHGCGAYCLTLLHYRDRLCTKSSTVAKTSSPGSWIWRMFEWCVRPGNTFKSA